MMKYAPPKEKENIARISGEGAWSGFPKLECGIRHYHV